jgi:hypothetical protein
MTVIDTDIERIVNADDEQECESTFDGLQCPSPATWMGVPRWQCTCDGGPVYMCDRCHEIASSFLGMISWRARCHVCQAPILGFKHWERIR